MFKFERGTPRQMRRWGKLGIWFGVWLTRLREGVARYGVLIGDVPHSRNYAIIVRTGKTDGGGAQGPADADDPFPIRIWSRDSVNPDHCFVGNGLWALVADHASRAGVAVDTKVIRARDPLLRSSDGRVAIVQSVRHDEHDME